MTRNRWPVTTPSEAGANAGPRRTMTRRRRCAASEGAAGRLLVLGEADGTAGWPDDPAVPAVLALPHPHRMTVVSSPLAAAAPSASRAGCRLSRMVRPSVSARETTPGSPRPGAGAIRSLRGSQAKAYILDVAGARPVPSGVVRRHRPASPSLAQPPSPPAPGAPGRPPVTWALVKPVVAGPRSAASGAGPAEARPGGSRWAGWRPAWSAPAARAVRATIVVPGLFALTLKVIADPQMALFAVFGGFATLVMTSFGGTRRDKAVAHLGLATAGSIALVIGTAVSGTPWLAAIVTIPVTFAIFFAGVAGPNAASGVTAALLAYVLPVASAGGVATIGSRLEGWWLASAA